MSPPPNWTVKILSMSVSLGLMTRACKIPQVSVRVACSRRGAWGKHHSDLLGKTADVYAIRDKNIIYKTRQM